MLVLWERNRSSGKRSYQSMGNPRFHENDVSFGDGRLRKSLKSESKRAFFGAANFCLVTGPTVEAHLRRILCALVSQVWCKVKEELPLTTIICKPRSVSLCYQELRTPA